MPHNHKLIVTAVNHTNSVNIPTTDYAENKFIKIKTYTYIYLNSYCLAKTNKR